MLATISAVAREDLVGVGDQAEVLEPFKEAMVQQVSRLLEHGRNYERAETLPLKLRKDLDIEQPNRRGGVVNPKTASRHAAHAADDSTEYAGRGAGRPGLDQTGRDDDCGDQKRDACAEENKPQRMQREQRAERRSRHAAGVRHHPARREMPAPRLDRNDVGMRGEQHRLLRAVTAQPRDEMRGLAVRGDEDVHLGAQRRELRLQIFGERPRVSRSVRSIE